MTDHQPMPVAGYTPQSQFAVDVVNTNKELEEQVLQRLDYLGNMGNVDPRWLAIGRTGIEQAFMAINRAVFRPQRIGPVADPVPGADLPAA